MGDMDDIWEWERGPLRLSICGSGPQRWYQLEFYWKGFQLGMLYEHWKGGRP